MTEMFENVTLRICSTESEMEMAYVTTERDTFESNREYRKVKEKCDVHESGVGVLDVIKGERLIGIGHIERDETKWCGHTVDGSKTKFSP